MNAWLLASRPKTLPAAIAPVCAGCALAYKLTGVFSLWLAACTIASALAIQIATNFFNDILDADKGADTPRRLGPTRATATGMISRQHMIWAAIVVLGIAIAFSIPLIQAQGWLIIAIGLPSIYFSFGYTGGPFPLAYRGMGDFFVLCFFGLIAVAGTVYVQCGRWFVESMVAGLQIGLLSTALIAINNLRDHEEDRISNKRTLAVRFGVKFSRMEITLLCLLPHVLGIHFWPLRHLSALAWWPLPILALAIFISRSIWRTEPSRHYNKFLALAALQLVLFAVLFVVACTR